MLRVDGHREIGAGSRNGPRGSHGAARPIDHRDMARGGHVHKDPGSVGLEHEGLWMALQWDPPDLPDIGPAENGEPAPPGADVQHIGGSVVPNVVGVVATREPLHDLQRGTSNHRTLAVSAVGDDDPVPIGQEDYALRFSHARYARRASPGAEIDDLERVVSEGGHEQSLPGEV